ncbi:MAG: cytochrome C [Betaproteobacteria bacterium]|nr:cytochrome C [Betaproteobacteria bacterium]
MGFRLWRLLLISSAAWLATAAGAQSIEGVLMPGKVIAGHAKYEQECGNCHVKFDKAAQDKLCLDCHKDVAGDVGAKQGFHGRSKPEPCRTCHTDHKGRDVKIARFDERAFDHAKTDFLLAGAHPRVECKACHAPGKKFRDAPGACNDCHRKDDKHKGSLGVKCADCHTQTAWKETRFDHGKTRFALSFKHVDVACKDCHKNNIYNNAPTTCVGCHKKDDKQHRGRLGDKCESCHTTKDWKESKFQHDRDTKYPLQGKHRTAKCETCHAAPPAREKTPTACVACHKKDDKQHRGRLGDKCESCHMAKDWKESTFQHDRDTKYPLQGKHRTAKCESCHAAPPAREKTPTACVACHKKDDKQHQGRLGDKCESCHTTKDWKESKFQHDRDTKYPLRGKHRTAKCETCHTASPGLARTPTTCAACHKADDKHNGTLGTECASCHTERDWKEAKYDHELSDFKLRGKHRDVECKDCHRDPKSYKGTPQTCIGCHKKDDTHKDRYGDKCATCHTEKTWPEIVFRHDRDTKYALTGRHVSVKCDTCHTGHVYRDKLTTDCYACHRKDDKHREQLGLKCEQCHDTTDWKKTVRFDHNKSRFPLLGRHARVECKACHASPAFKDARVECVACHEKEDTHKRTLGTDCGVCHNARDWKIWDFDHGRKTKFALEAAHRPLACASCHKRPAAADGKVPALGTTCGVCHQADDIHYGAFGSQCERCHTAVSWRDIRVLRDRLSIPQPPAGNAARTGARP